MAGSEPICFEDDITENESSLHIAKYRFIKFMLQLSSYKFTDMCVLACNAKCMSYLGHVQKSSKNTELETVGEKCSRLTSLMSIHAHTEEEKLVD